MRISDWSSDVCSSDLRGEDWREAPLRFHDNDRWRGEFAIERQAPHEFTIIAWRDLFATWQDEVRRKCEAGQGVASEGKEGAHLLEQAADGERASQAGGAARLAGPLAEIAAAQEEARGREGGG